MPSLVSLADQLVTVLCCFAALQSCCEKHTRYFNYCPRCGVETNGDEPVDEQAAAMVALRLSTLHSPPHSVVSEKQRYESYLAAREKRNTLAFEWGLKLEPNGPLVYLKLIKKDLGVQAALSIAPSPLPSLTSLLPSLSSPCPSPHVISLSSPRSLASPLSLITPPCSPHLPPPPPPSHLPSRRGFILLYSRLSTHTACPFPQPLPPLLPPHSFAGGATPTPAANPPRDAHHQP